MPGWPVDPHQNWISGSGLNYPTPNNKQSSTVGILAKATLCNYQLQVDSEINLAGDQGWGRRHRLLSVCSGAGGMASMSPEVMTAAAALLAEGRKYEVERSTQTEGHKTDDLEH